MKRKMTQNEGQTWTVLICVYTISLLSTLPFALLQNTGCIFELYISIGITVVFLEKVYRNT